MPRRNRQALQERLQRKLDSRTEAGQKRLAEEAALREEQHQQRLEEEYCLNQQRLQERKMHIERCEKLGLPSTADANQCEVEELKRAQLEQRLLEERQQAAREALEKKRQREEREIRRLEQRPVFHSAAREGARRRHVAIEQLDVQLKQTKENVQCLQEAVSNAVALVVGGEETLRIIELAFETSGGGDEWEATKILAEANINDYRNSLVEAEKMEEQAMQIVMNLEKEFHNLKTNDVPDTPKRKANKKNKVLEQNGMSPLVLATPSQCIVCWESDATHAFVPCGHRCVCDICGKQLLARELKKCPVCRASYQRLMKVY